MEERRLNFNAPLLSVRRYSTTQVTSSDRENGKIVENSRLNRRYTIPFYRSDLNLEQVTEPATVPFMWEQIPGRPKEGSPEPQYPEEASVTPRLPPQRTLDIIKYPLEKEVKDRPKTESCSLDDNVNKLDSPEEGDDVKNNSDLEKDDDDFYSDALSTLSPTDSYSMNCSVTGLSGCDGQIVKPSGTFSTDPQTRDFMMSRFLPAAKAMALEPPQYASRKQPVAIEQPRQIVKAFSADRRPSVKESIVIPQYSEDVDEEESEHEVEEYDYSGNVLSKGCGLFPRLCFNKSLCLLNPVPGLKVRTHSSLSSSSEVRKSVKPPYIESHSQNVKKHALDAGYKLRSNSGVQSPRLLGIESKITSGSNRFTCSGEQQMSNRSSPFRRGISPYRNDRPQSPFRGGGFLGVPKEADNLKANRLNMCSKGSKSQELVTLHSFKKGSGSLSPTVEKTLYVDTVSFSKISFSNSSSSDTKRQMDSSKNIDTSIGSRGIEETARAASSLQDLNRHNISKGGHISENKMLESLEPRRSSFSGVLRPTGQADIVECFRPNGELDQECKSLACIKVTANENLNSSSEQNLEVADTLCINNGSEQSPLPLPLPKKPSESWLWRTLPSVSSQNPSSHSYIGTRFHPKRQDPKTALTNTKWETIVKTSYSHHDHVRYSEELTTRISQQSKS